MLRQLSAEREVLDMLPLDMRSTRNGKKEYLFDFIGTGTKLTAWIADEILEESLKSARDMAIKKKPEKKGILKLNPPEQLKKEQLQEQEQNVPRKERVSRKEQPQSKNGNSRAGHSKSVERSSSRGRDKRVNFGPENKENLIGDVGVVTRSMAKAALLQKRN